MGAMQRVWWGDMEDIDTDWKRVEPGAGEGSNRKLRGRGERKGRGGD